MGIVYQGIHIRLEQTVAIKDLSPELASDPDMRSRFIREAKIQARLNHPNVVNVHNLLEHEGRLLLVMEFVEGQTLDKIIQERGALPSEEAVRIAKQVLDALAFMHSKGVIHRDLKPGNIIITPEGRVKVTDFGIAKATTEQSHTRAGTRLGTLWYMSPEQVKGKPVDARSDLYAMGVTLFQMVTGKLPFFGNSDFEIMKAHTETPPPNPKKIKKDVPKPLSGIILKLLEKDPEKRFQTADEVLKALESQTERPKPSSHLPREPKRVEQIANAKLPFAQKAAGLPVLVWILIGILVLGAGLFMFVYWYVNRKQAVIPVVKAPVLEKKAEPVQEIGPTGPQIATQESEGNGQDKEKDVTSILEELGEGKGKTAEKEESAPQPAGHLTEKKKEDGVTPTSKGEEKRIESPSNNSVSPSKKTKKLGPKGEIVEMTPTGGLKHKNRKISHTSSTKAPQKRAKSPAHSYVEMGPQGSLKNQKTVKGKKGYQSRQPTNNKEKKPKKDGITTVDKQIGHFFKSLKKSLKEMEHPSDKHHSKANNTDEKEKDEPVGFEGAFPRR